MSNIRQWLMLTENKARNNGVYVKDYTFGECKCGLCHATKGVDFCTETKCFAGGKYKNAYICNACLQVLTSRNDRACYNKLNANSHKREARFQVRISNVKLTDLQVGTLWTNYNIAPQRRRNGLYNVITMWNDCKGLQDILYSCTRLGVDINSIRVYAKQDGVIFDRDELANENTKEFATGVLKYETPYENLQQVIYYLNSLLMMAEYNDYEKVEELTNLFESGSLARKVVYNKKANKIYIIKK